MREYGVLIEPEEAARLWGYRGVEDTYRADAIAKYVVKQNASENDRLWLNLKILSTVYLAGRIQDIREERQRRRERASKC